MDTVKLIVLCVLVASTANSASAFEVATHQQLSLLAARGSALDLFARNTLGLTAGLSEFLSGHTKPRTVEDWIGEGSVREDDHNGLVRHRYLNHFHNPLRTWDKAGLFGGAAGSSSAVWAQFQTGATPMDASWFNSRRALYMGLTSPAPMERERQLATAFQILGHQIHLVQDGAVTAHTRDDAHLSFLGRGDPELLETHIDQLLDDAPSVFEALLGSPIRFDPSILNLPANPFAPLPIARIFDTSDGDDPAGTAKSGTAVGIAEFTNANFFSGDTILDGFVLPSQESLSDRIVDFVQTPLGPMPRGYRGRVVDGAMVRHFVAESLLAQPFESNFTLYRYGLSLDSTVIEDYARHLLPRAVGYSAGLIDYFIRGDLELVPGKGNRFDVENRGTEELEGQIEIFYDSVDGARTNVGGGSTPRGFLKPGERMPVALNWPTYYTPQTLGEFTVVFRGRLGREGNATGENFAVAVGRSVVSPPQVAPGLSAGANHGVMLGEAHTHGGAWAYDPNGDLASYQWSWGSCPTPCPPLANTTGSLSGGTSRVSVPGPTFTIPSGGNWNLVLEVRDRAGNRSQSTSIHDFPEYFVRAFSSGSGQIEEYGAPFVWSGFGLCEGRAFVGETFSCRLDVVPDRDEAIVLPARVVVWCAGGGDECASGLRDNLVGIEAPEGAPYSKGIPFPAEELYRVVADLVFTVPGDHSVAVEWDVFFPSGGFAGTSSWYVPVRVG